MWVMYFCIIWNILEFGDFSDAFTGLMWKVWSTMCPFSALHVWAWSTMHSSVVSLPQLTTGYHVFFRCPKEQVFLSWKSMKLWPRTTCKQKQQTTSEQVNASPNGLHVGTDRSNCCIWCCRMAHVTWEGKSSCCWGWQLYWGWLDYGSDTCSLQWGSPPWPTQQVAQLWTTGPRCLDVTGLNLWFTVAALAQLQCKCTKAVKPGQAGAAGLQLRFGNEENVQLFTQI